MNGGPPSAHFCPEVKELLAGQAAAVQHHRQCGLEHQRAARRIEVVIGIDR